MDLNSLYMLNRKQAAAFLGVSESTIARWSKAGKMPEPVVKMHAKQYWRRVDLEAMKTRLLVKSK